MVATVEDSDVVDVAGTGVRVEGTAGGNATDDEATDERGDVFGV